MLLKISFPRRLHSSPSGAVIHKGSYLFNRKRKKKKKVRNFFLKNDSNYEGNFYIFLIGQNGKFLLLKP